MKMEIPIPRGDWNDIRFEAPWESKFPVRVGFWHIIEHDVHPSNEDIPEAWFDGYGGA